MPRKMGVDMPRTLLRSPPKAQRTYAKTMRSAEETYGSGERAARTAISSLKHSFEKVGDHWEPKKRKGPSDPKAKARVGTRRHEKAESFGGVDLEGNTRDELYQRARELDIAGRSSMNKKELARAIAKKQG
ncbi:MAG TPA: ChaB family protein [Burkholderiaceae bacterium]|nr:ChaB family protein [Burkholderiaceae bacterium]